MAPNRLHVLVILTTMNSVVLLQLSERHNKLIPLPSLAPSMFKIPGSAVYTCLYNCFVASFGFSVPGIVHLVLSTFPK